MSSIDQSMAIEVSALARQRALEAATAGGDSAVQRFYRGAVVLLTGGTGFMGKQLIEKLFRSCEISKLYLLLRPKKGQGIHYRVVTMLQDPCFDQVRKQKPDFAQYVIPVKGDVANERLGLSDQDWTTLINEVEVIYHLAATTRFDESMRVATLINVRGTRETLLLAKACAKLKSFVHVSTCYTQAVQEKIGQEVFEKFTPSPIPPDTLINLIETADDSRLEEFSKIMMKGYPNTYTFCKAVAEDLVRSMSDGLPICIVRPAIVIGAYREPIQGWLDQSCMYGASGVPLGTGLGLIHLVYINDETKVSLVPCDYVNNAIIVAGKEATLSRGGEYTKIYAVSSAARNPLHGGDFVKLLYDRREELHSPKTVYYCYEVLCSNRRIFDILTLLMHIVPGYIVDFVCLLLGKERRMVKLYKKAYKMSIALGYFLNHTWIFDDTNLETLYKSQSTADNAIFNFDVKDISWSEYLHVWCLGIRAFIVKDGLEGTEAAAKRQYWYRLAHYTFTALYIYMYWKVFCVLWFVVQTVFSLF